MGTKIKRAEVGYTIVEVMLFFGVTGALMLGILGTATLGVNAQRYNDAVNTFAAIVQQEFTNATNVVNTESIDSLCDGTTNATQPRGVSSCVIMGRLMTIDSTGKIERSNIIGKEDTSAVLSSTASELDVALSYRPTIDTQSKEVNEMNWDTNIEKSTFPGGSNVSFIVLRSPRSGNLYSYVIHDPASPISNNGALVSAFENLKNDPNGPQNAKDQYMCIDRSGWVLTPTRVVKIAPYTSGPSGVSTVENSSGTLCN